LPGLSIASIRSSIGQGFDAARGPLIDAVRLERERCAAIAGVFRDSSLAAREIQRRISEGVV